ncbi:MAG: pitrilysin family protein [Polyangiaceae bacterium]
MTQTLPSTKEGDRAGQRRAELLRELNDGKPPGAQLEYEGSVPLGPAMLVHRFKLGNGLTVLTSIDASAPVVSYHTWFAVGSRHEKVGKTGLAHLFEHLMFNETEKHPAGSFDRTLEEAGAESNAATWVDWTFYHESIPKDRVGLVIELEAERMSKLVLREPQVTSEKEVVANERRYRVDDDVEGAVSELLYKTAYTKHAYSWPTIGWMADIEGFTTEDCAGFYRTYYAPNNATVVVVGDFRERDLLAKIQKAYGSLESAEIPVEDVIPEPPQTEERKLSVKKPTATDKLAIAYHGPAFGDVDHVPLAMLCEVLFSGRSSRMHRALVQDQEIATELRGWVGTFRDPSLFEIYATARPGKTAAELLVALDRELAKVIAEPVTTAELEKVKAKVELALVQSLETASGKAEQIGFYHTVLGDPGGSFARLDAYRRTTRSDLLRVARRYIVNSRRTIIEVHPEAAAEERG